MRLFGISPETQETAQLRRCHQQIGPVVARLRRMFTIRYAVNTPCAHSGGFFFAVVA